MTPTDRSIREYLASIGSKGGKATGQRKARSPEHYAKMVAQRISKAGVQARKAKRKAK